MADRSINELPVATLLTDDGLLVVYQDGKTLSLRGELVKQYAQESVSQYVEGAKTAAQAAEAAAGDAQAAAEEAQGVSLYPPKVNPDTGVWQTWDAAQQQYVDTDQQAEGPRGPAGSSIQSIERTSGTGAPGTTDTYTVTLTNGSTTTFQVYNGADGAGTGDFKADGSVPMTGALQMAGHTISGLPAPVSDSDPVRKQDVQTLAADRQLSNLDTPQAALANLGAGVRPNLLDNPYFVGGGSQQGGGQLPINQKGETIYENGDGFDRWMNSSQYVTAEITPDGVSISSESNNQTAFISKLNLSDFVPGKKYTMSLLIKDTSSLVKAYFVGGSSAFASDGISSGGGITSVTFTMPTVTSGQNFLCGVRMSNAGTAKIAAAKLEEGDSQTLAYQKADGTWEMLPQQDMNYGMQLLKCQRHYQLYSSADKRPSKAVDCRPVMRVDPTQGTIVIDDETYYYNDASL